MSTRWKIRNLLSTLVSDLATRHKQVRDDAPDGEREVQMKRSLNIAATFLAGLGCSMQLETVTDSDRLVDVLKCGWVVTSESLTPPADSVEAACWRFTPANRTAIVLTSDHLGACDLPKEGHRVIVVPSETSVTYWATVGRADSGVDTHMDSIECPVTQGAGS